MYNPNFTFQPGVVPAPAQYQQDNIQPQSGYIQPPAYPAPAPFQPSAVPTPPVPIQPPQAAPFMPPTAGYSQPGGGAYALPQGGAGAGLSPVAYGGAGNVAGATPLGAQGPSFAGGSFYPQAQGGAGATPLGAQGPSYAGDVYQQIAGINQRLDQIGMSFGRPGVNGEMSGHEFLASVIAPEPAVPNNYLGGYGDGKLIPTVGTNNSGR